MWHLNDYIITDVINSGCSGTGNEYVYLKVIASAVNKNCQKMWLTVSVKREHDALFGILLSCLLTTTLQVFKLTAVSWHSCQVLLNNGYSSHQVYRFYVDFISRSESQCGQQVYIRLKQQSLEDNNRLVGGGIAKEKTHDFIIFVSRKRNLFRNIINSTDFSVNFVS